jgi:hypothetical protein
MRIDKAGNYTPFVAALSAALKARKKLLTGATTSYEGGMVPQGPLPFFAVDQGETADNRPILLGR